MQDLLLRFPENPSTPGGGGGPGHPITIPGTNVSINQYLDGFNVNLYGRSEEAWFHEIKSYEGSSSSNGHWHEKRSSGGAYWTLDQGFLNESYLPFENVISWERIDWDGNHRVMSSQKVAYFPEITDWTEPSGANYGYHIGGLNLSSNNQMEHESIFGGNGKDPIFTNDVRGYFDFNMEDSEIRDARLYISEFSYWFNDQVYKGIEIRAEFQMEYTGDDLAGFNASMPMIPEPATLMIMGLGSLILRGRKKE